MATKKVDIANLALLRAGQAGTTLTSLSDGTPTGDAMGTLFDTCAKLVLKALPWPHAKRTAVIQLDGLHTDAIWSYAYFLPPDFLHALKLPSALNQTDGQFVVEGTRLLTNHYDGDNGSYLTYIRSDAVDPMIVDPWPEYVDCLAWRLAAEYVPAIQGDAEVGTLMLNQYMVALRNARRAIGASQHRDIGLSNGYVDARLSGPTPEVSSEAE